MDQWIELLKEFGFPVVVTLYLLHRIEMKLERLNQSIQSLPGQIKLFVEK